jgi:hypothetical protein
MSKDLMIKTRFEIKNALNKYEVENLNVTGLIGSKEKCKNVGQYINVMHES